jgi:type IV pilus assembly protein PilE
VTILHQRARGFTLIELMVTIAIVAILAAIAIPSYQEQVRKSRRGQAKADLVEYAQTAERWHSINNTYVGWAPTSNVSPSTGAAHYSIVESNLSATTFTLTATPTSAAQIGDRCGTLTIDQAGRRTHSSGTDNECGFGTSP